MCPSSWIQQYSFWFIYADWIFSNVYLHLVCLTSAQLPGSTQNTQPKSTDKDQSTVAAMANYCKSSIKQYTFSSKDNVCWYPSLSSKGVVWVGTVWHDIECCKFLLWSSLFAQGHASSNTTFFFFFFFRLYSQINAGCENNTLEKTHHGLLLITEHRFWTTQVSYWRKCKTVLCALLKHRSISYTTYYQNYY